VPGGLARTRKSGFFPPRPEDTAAKSGVSAGKYGEKQRIGAGGGTKYAPEHAGQL
jgi:hypothetical protein